jgi:CO dehydrogenase nickel-insertion accessory protein CooC1
MAIVETSLVNPQSVTEIKNTLEKLPLFFQVIGETLENGCQCRVCAVLRKELLKMAKQHDVTVITQKYGDP